MGDGYLLARCDVVEGDQLGFSERSVCHGDHGASEVVECFMVRREGGGLRIFLSCPETKVSYTCVIKRIPRPQSGTLRLPWKWDLVTDSR